jgi:hypothetical protein
MKATVLFITSLIFIAATCEEPVDTVVGSSNDTEIKNMSFTLDTTYLSGASLVARGKAQNDGRDRITPTWYVEAQFYTDSTYITKLGGNNTAINVPLDPGQQTFWTISFSSAQVDVRQFPRFRVKDIRAIYKN